MLLKDKITNRSLESPKKVYPELPLAKSTKDYLQRYRDNHKISVDRFIFSELCYGPILRNATVFTHLETVEMLVSLFESGSFLIFCLPDDFVFKRDESPAVMQNIRTIYAAYCQWSMLSRQISKHPERIIRFQWNVEGSYDLLKNRILRLTK